MEKRSGEEAGNNLRRGDPAKIFIRKYRQLSILGIDSIIREWYNIVVNN